MKKKILLSIVILATLLTIVSCAALFGGGTASEFDPKSCVIVTPASESSNSELKSATVTVETAFYSKHGVKPSTKNDSSASEDGVSEILIGKTDRALSTEALALLPQNVGDDVHAFAILVKNGNMAIVATSDAAYKIAARWFANNAISEIKNGYSKTMFTTESIRQNEGTKATCYDISTMYSDIFIESVTLGDEIFEKFDIYCTSYDILLQRQDTDKEIKISHPSFVTSTTEWKNDNQYNITLSSMDKSKTVTYSFYFDRLEYDILANAKIEKVYGARDAIVVIVHDDGTHATVDYMADSFELNGLVGTLGLITKNLASKNSGGNWVLKQSEVNYWRSILSRGVFDVASHSHTHSFWGISDEAESGYYLDSGNNLHEYSFEAGRITEEVAGSREILKMAFPDQDVLMMIKPGFGRVSDANGTKGMTQISDKAYEIIAANYIGMRDTGGGVTTIPIENYYKINSFSVQYKNTAQDWQNAVNSAIKQNGMIVFLYHTIIEDDPSKDGNSYTAKMSEADAFFEWLGEKNANGTVWNTFLEDAVLYATEYAETKLDAKDFGDRIELTLTNTLDQSIYNHPLTVTVPVSKDATSVTAIDANGNRTKLDIVREGSEYCVRIDMIPNGSTLTLVID